MPTVVEAVYPTAERLPENQLKFYLHFSAPMSRGEAYRRVQLLDEKGKAVELPGMGKLVARRRVKRDG